MSAGEAERWAHVRALFDALVDSAPASWDARLAVEARGDAELAKEVRSLLAAHVAAQSTHGLEPPGETVVAEWLAPLETRDLSARRIGSCVLGKRIASGGMGVVYEAEQDAPRRRVAVKVLRLAFSEAATAARFAHEATVLGALRHPGIAQVFEAGVHVEAGGEQVPYLVMELVEGATSITAYADAHALDVPARVALVTAVCDAVHHAHRRGVIHRDLKPSNLLVDGEGRARVIDFGIARSTEGDDGLTRTGQVLGTPAYMSPEQIDGRTEDVDVRSDVYALGVILYELLVGKRPYSLDGLSISQAARVVRETEPPRPEQVRPELSGDLSAIVRTALAKDPARRYDGAGALADDLRRWARHEPVAAHPPSAWHRLALVARRHRGASLAGAVAVLALVGGLVASLAFAASERRQHRRADVLLSRTKDLAPWVLREVDHSLARLPGSLDARTRLAQGIRDRLDGLEITEEDDPEVLAAVADGWFALGDVLGGAGRPSLRRYDEAEAAYARAAGLQEQRGRLASAARLAAYDLNKVRLAWAALRIERGVIDTAVPLLDAARHVIDAQLAASGADLVARRASLFEHKYRGHAHWYANRVEQALAEYVAARVDAEALTAGKPMDADTIDVAMNAEMDVGTTLAYLGREAEGRTALDRCEALAARLEAAAPGEARALEHSWYVYRALGDVDEDAKRLEAALARFDKACRIAERVVALDPNDVAAKGPLLTSYSRRGGVLYLLGRGEEALPDLTRARDLAETLAAKEPPGSRAAWDARHTSSALGRDLVQLSRWAEAEAPLRRALALATERLAAQPNERDDQRALADAEADLGRVRLSLALGADEATRNAVATEAARLLVSAASRRRALAREGAAGETDRKAAAGLDEDAAKATAVAGGR